MTSRKTMIAGIGLAVLVYVGAAHGSSFFRSDVTTAVIGESLATSSLAPSAKKMPLSAKPSGTNVALSATVVSPSLSPSVTPVAPVIPRVTTGVSPSQNPSALSTATPTATPIEPRISTPTPFPSPTPTPSVSETPTTTPEPTATPIPVMPHIVINEIAWAGTASASTDEWVELYNAGSEAINLTGWSLRGDPDSKGSTLIITLTGSIQPGAYYLIERTDDTTVSDISGDVVGPFGGSGLNNSGENLSLQDAEGVERDSIPCSGTGWFKGESATKASMERVDASLSGSVASNWETNTGLITTGVDASGNALRGTPKFKNSVTP